MDVFLQDNEASAYYPSRSTDTVLSQKVDAAHQRRVSDKRMMRVREKDIEEPRSLSIIKQGRPPVYSLQGPNHLGY